MKKNNVKNIMGIVLCLVFIGAIAVGGFYLVRELSSDQSNSSELVLTEQAFEKSQFVMDTLITQKSYDGQSETVFDELISTFQEYEGRISRYQAKSEISNINNFAGVKAVEVSESTYTLLKEAYRLCEESNGVFDITMGSVIDLWGITSEQPIVPTDGQIATALENTGYQNIEFNDEKMTVKLIKPFIKIDLGGLAKGYATDMAYSAYKTAGLSDALLSTNSSILAFGSKPNAQGYTIGVRDPRGTANEFIGLLTVKDAFVGTSGDYERFFEKNNKRYHHILDPSTGKPSDSGLIGITVVNNNGMYADYLSTYLFIMGKEYVIEHINEYDIIAVDDQKNIYVSDGVKDHFAFDADSGYRLK